MKATILSARHGKVAVVEFENAPEFHEFDNVVESLVMVGHLDVRLYFQPRHMKDVLNALEAVDADLDIRQPEGS